MKLWVDFCNGNLSGKDVFCDDEECFPLCCYFYCCLLLKVLECQPDRAVQWAISPESNGMRKPKETKPAILAGVGTLQSVSFTRRPSPPAKPRSKLKPVTRRGRPRSTGKNVNDVIWILQQCDRNCFFPHHFTLERLESYRWQVTRRSSFS